MRSELSHLTPRSDFADSRRSDRLVRLARNPTVGDYGHQMLGTRSASRMSTDWLRLGHYAAPDQARREANA